MFALTAAAFPTGCSDSVQLDRPSDDGDDTGPGDGDGDGDSDADGDGDSDGDGDGDGDADADGDGDGDTDSDGDVDGDGDADSDGDGDTGEGKETDSGEATDGMESGGDSDSDGDGDGDTGAGGDSDGDSDTEGGANSDTGIVEDPDGGVEDSDTGPDTGHKAPIYPELWYASGNLLVYVEIDPSDGTVMQVVSSEISGVEMGFNSITMLEDGSLVGARISDGEISTRLYHVPDPPRDGSPVTAVDLGTMADSIGIEALYTDCEGRLYAMDTGVNIGSFEGNRLLRFTGDYLAGDFEYTVVSDLATADVADIDDMGPGIDGEGKIIDNPGMAIDTATVYDFNFETGQGTDMGGRVSDKDSWGIHTLGAPLFEDRTPRVYILNQDGELFMLDMAGYTLSQVLMQGPEVQGTQRGRSGLAGPLTECETGFTPMV